MRLRQTQVSGPDSVSIQVGGNFTARREPERYTSDLVFDMIRTEAGDMRTGWQIPPGGWLAAILVRKLDYPHKDLQFELTDYDGSALYASFTVDQLLNCGGIMLPEPIPNVNAACPYVLKIPAGCPALEIITVNHRPL